SGNERLFDLCGETSRVSRVRLRGKKKLGGYGVAAFKPRGEVEILDSASQQQQGGAQAFAMLDEIGRRLGDQLGQFAATDEILGAPVVESQTLGRGTARERGGQQL